MALKVIGMNDPCGIYSLDHIIALIVLIFLIVLGLFLSRKITEKGLKIQTLVIASLITIFEVVKIVVNIKNGRRGYDQNLPLQFCSLFIYSSWMALSKNNLIRKCGSLWLMTAGASAGLSYIIYPSTSLTYFPLFHFMSFHGLFYHALSCYLGLLYFIKSDIRPTKKNYKYYIFFLVPFFIAAILIDYIEHVNLMFFYESYMLPKVLTNIKDFCRPLYTLTVVIGLSVFPYLFISIINRLIHKNK